MRYTIKKGYFSSGINIGIHNKRVSQTYKVRFDSSCLYDDSLDKGKWNSLNGWAYGSKDSIRFLWRVNPKINTRIDIGLRYYQDDRRSSHYFTTINIDEWYTIGVFYKEKDLEGVSNPRIVLTCTHKPDDDDSATFIATKTVQLEKPFEVKVSYKLYPYFGGNIPAPHNMTILSEET